MSPLWATALIIYWFVWCIEMWEIMNQDTSLPHRVLHRLKSEEKSQTDGKQHVSLWIELLQQWAIVWRAVIPSLATVKL